RERRAARGGRAAVLLLLHRLRVIDLADLRRAGLEDLVEHARVERARRDRVGVDLRRRDLGRERLGEADDAGLRGALRAQVRARLRRAAAREVHDLAVAAPAHVRKDLAAGADGAEEVHGDRVDPLRPLDLIDRAERAIAAGVVDEDVDLALEGLRGG